MPATRPMPRYRIDRPREARVEAVEIDRTGQVPRVVIAGLYLVLGMALAGMAVAVYVRGLL